MQVNRWLNAKSINIFDHLFYKRRGWIDKNNVYNLSGKNVLHVSLLFTRSCISNGISGHHRFSWPHHCNKAKSESRRKLITITVTITMGMMKISGKGKVTEKIEKVFWLQLQSRWEWWIWKLKLVSKAPPLILVTLPNCNRCPLTETKNIENAGNDDEDNIMKVCAGWKVSLNTYPLLESWNVIVQKG